MGMKNDLEDSEKIFSQIANANRFFRLRAVVRATGGTVAGRTETPY
jgi:hypothetical protein